MGQSCDKNSQSIGSKSSGKSFLAKIINKMAGLSVVDRRRNSDRRKGCEGYTGPERRSGIDRRMDNFV